MAPRSVKIAVTIPKAVYRAVERIRHQLGLSRSALVDQAVEEWLKKKNHADEIRRYVESYRRDPENISEIRAWQSVQAWTMDDDWS